MPPKMSSRHVWRSNPKPKADFRTSDSVEALKAVLRAAQEENETLQSRLAALEVRLERQEGQVDDLLGSRIWRTLMAGGRWLLRARGMDPSRQPIHERCIGGPTLSEYREWMHTHDPLFDSGWVGARISAFSWRPQFSAIVGAPKANREQTDRTIRSLDEQTYPHWELGDEKGDFVFFLEPGDQLAPNALFLLADALNSDPDIDLLYTDEDVLDPVEGRSSPFFKPDWSPELFASRNYVGGLLACRSDLFAGVTGSGDDAALMADHNLTLRLCNRADRIAHVPQVLYHRHPAPTEQADSDIFSDRPRTSAGTASPAVSILIPTCSRTLVEDAVNSLIANTDYPHYEIVVVDNSRGRSIQRFAAGRNLGYCDCRGWPFSFARLINHAAGQTTSPYLLLLNDDTKVTESGWLRALVDMILKPGAGAVGARLLFPDRTIQHAGVVVGLHGTCGHAFRGLPADRPHYHGLASMAREVSAVTGACLLTRRSCFQEVNGLDEAHFPVAFQDVDYCLRLRSKGYRILYTPAATLIHQESRSITDRGIRASSAELQAFRRRWADVIDSDPYYSPHLTRHDTDYRIRTGRYLG